jgi:hypothetical protein
MIISQARLTNVSIYYLISLFDRPSTEFQGILNIFKVPRHL